MTDAAFSFGTSTATTPAVIASTGAATHASGFFSGDAPSFSVISLPNKGTGTKDPEIAPAFMLGAASLSSAATPSPRRLSPRHLPWPSHSAPECPNHTSEAKEHPEPLPDIVHHYLENGGGQRVTLMIYDENTKAQ